MASPPFAEPMPRSPVVPLPVLRSRLVRPPLPRPPTSLVGREREVAELCALLELAEVRLVTLTGPGGVGKTRLALRVAEELAGAFDDGVVFIGLAQILDPAQVVPAIAHGLGVREAGDRDSADLLRDALVDRRLLLALDNLEQVLAATPHLADLLLTSPA